MIDLKPIGDFIREFGLPMALLIFAGVTGARGQWMFRWVHDSIVALMAQQLVNARAERDDWRSIALGTLKVAEVVVDKPSVRPR